VIVPGSYFTGQVGKVKYVVARGDDGLLRGFHNVCRHHAMEVASMPGDCAEGSQAPAVTSCFACPYHGWTYDLTGKLIKATRLTGIENFDVKKNGLRPLAVEQWGPFIFCHLGGGSGDDDEARNGSSSEDIDAHNGGADPPPPLPPPAGRCTSMGKQSLLPPPVSEWLGEGGRRMASARIDTSLRFITRREYRIACNWKVFCDNYLDGGYHVPFAHPALADGVDMKSYETTIHGSVSLQTVGGASASSDPVPSPGAVADRRLGNSAMYAFVYPNFMVNRYGPWLDTNWVTPTGPDSCVVVFDYYLEPELANDAKFIAESLAASDLVQKEDMWLCGKVQRGIESPGYGAGRYAPSMEAAMYHFHKCLWEDISTP